MNSERRFKVNSLVMSRDSIDHQSLDRSKSKKSAEERLREVRDVTLAPTASSKHVFLFLVLGLFFGLISLQAMSVVLAWRERFVALFGHTLLCLVAGSSAIWSVSLCISCFKRRQSSQEEADWTLIFLAIVAPTVLLFVRFNPLPTSDDSKVNCIITYAFLLRLGALMDFSPAHSMVQMFLSFPLFTYLDYNRRCNNPSVYPDTCTFLIFCDENESCPSPTHCCSIITFFHHLVTRGLLMLIAGTIAVSVPVIMAVKMKLEKIEAATIMCRSKSTPADRTYIEDPPLDSLGFNILRLTNTEDAVLLFEKWMESISGMVNESILVSLVCVPIGFYYFGHSLLSRVMPKVFSTHAVTSDEWLLALSVFFVLGRESCKIDMNPAMKDVQEKLKASHEILQDVLPPHVVDLLVNHKEETVEEEEEGLGEEENWNEDDQALNAFVSKIVSSRGGHHEDDPNSEELDLIDESLIGPGPSSKKRLAKRNSNNRRSMDVMKLKTVDEDDNNTNGSSSLRQFIDLAASGSIPTIKSASGPNKGSGVRSFSLAENHDCVSVFFSDIVGFSSWAHALPAARVMETLNDLYTRLDDVLLNEMPGLYKVETIGDAYMVAGNLTTYDSKHAATVIRFAMRAQQEASKVPRPDMKDGSTLQLRIGELDL